jgi:hypothetical protein
MRCILFFAILFNSFNFAQAADLSLGLGAGVGKSVLDTKAFERFGKLSLSYGGAWRLQANAGYWHAVMADERSSPWASLQGGISVAGDSGMFASFMIGPAYVLNTDHKTSGNLVCHMTMWVGIQDDSGRRLGFMADHYSDAGNTRPNDGRDALMLAASAPIWKAKRQ